MGSTTTTLFQTRVGVVKRGGHVERLAAVLNEKSFGVGGGTSGYWGYDWERF